MWRIPKGLPQVKSATFNFTSQRNVVTIGKLLATHRGRHSPEHRFHALVNSLLLYDHFAQAFAHANGLPAQIGPAWRAFAAEPAVDQIFQTFLPWSDQGVIGEIEFDLPIASASPLFTGTAPAGIAPGNYQLKNLTCVQFVEIAWKVRCNLLHGSYEPSDSETWMILQKTARPMTALSWHILENTPL